jgi:putative intracellular protease/amidase
MNFTFLAAPYVTAISPRSIAPAGGGTMTLYGDNLNAHTLDPPVIELIEMAKANGKYSGAATGGSSAMAWTGFV